MALCLSPPNDAVSRSSVVTDQGLALKLAPLVGELRVAGPWQFGFWCPAHLTCRCECGRSTVALAVGACGLARCLRAGACAAQRRQWRRGGTMCLAKKAKDSLGPESLARRERSNVLKVASEQCWPGPILQKGALDKLGLPCDDGGTPPHWSSMQLPGTGRCRFRVAYDGTQYNGWMRVRGGSPLSVAGILDNALSVFLESDVYVIGAGRTDAGVHARGQVAHFDVPSEILTARATDWRTTWEAKVNSLLPRDISVFSFDDAPADFHATFSASGKKYTYRMHIGEACPPDPFERLYRHQLPHAWARDFQGAARLEEAVSKFVGTHHFACFSKEDRGRPHADRDTVRTISSALVVDEGCGRYRLEFQLDGALWRMVRNVVGCAIAAACGRLPMSLIDCMFDAGFRGPQPFMCMPAEGLTLEEVYYAGELR